MITFLNFCNACSSMGHATFSCQRLEVNKHAQVTKNLAKSAVEKLKRVFCPKEDEPF